MGKLRVYELAQERGLTSRDLLDHLESAGIRGKKPLSTLETEEVDAVLEHAGLDGVPAEAPAEQKPPGAKPTRAKAKTVAPRAKPAAETPAAQRLRLRRRLWQLRRLHDAQLKELAGLAVELHRLDSPRYDELAGERLEAAAATDKELIALERQLAPDAVGGECPKCGLHSTRTRYCLRCGTKLPGRSRTDALSIPGAIVAIVAIATAWLLGGVDLSSHNTSKQATNVAATRVAPNGAPGAGKPKFASIVATVHRSRIGVYHSPGGSPYTTLSNPNLDGAPLVFLVKSISGRWAQVMLPVRPNGSTGWIKLSKVSLAGHDFRVLIDLHTHHLTAWNASKIVLRTPVGVGRAVTPTPSGLYYITELLKQPDPTGVYGPYAFGLSAHSNVLNEFAGRDGILGIHGTNFPQGIGTNVSHGCIRMSNKAIRKLARTLPVGTPVRITRA